MSVIRSKTKAVVSEVRTISADTIKLLIANDLGVSPDKVEITFRIAADVNDDSRYPTQILQGAVVTITQ